MHYLANKNQNGAEGGQVNLEISNLFTLSTDRVQCDSRSAPVSWMLYLHCSAACSTMQHRCTAPLLSETQDLHNFCRSGERRVLLSPAAVDTVSARHQQIS